MIVLKDRFVSCIDDEEVRKFKQSSSRSRVKQQKIFEDKTATQVMSAGIELAKKNKRKIVCEKTREL